MPSVILDAVNYLSCLQLLPQKGGGLLCLPCLPALSRSPGHHKHHRKAVFRKLSPSLSSCSGAEVNCSTGMNDCTDCHRSLNSWPMPTCRNCSLDILVLNWIPTTSFPFFWNKACHSKAVSPAMPKKEKAIFSILLFDLQHYRFVCCCCCFWGLDCIFPICRCDV